MQISYCNKKVGDVNIFYRKSGSPSRPTVVLLHGFPSSSHMYRSLIPFWAEFLEPYWKERNAETEKKVRSLLTIDTTRFQYTQGARNPENVNPDSYTFDQMILDRPGNAEIQLALFHDYQTNLKEYP